MTSAGLQSLDSDDTRCDTCRTCKKWHPDDIEADLVKKTGLCSYIELKSKVEPVIREKVFDNSRDRWLAYSAANLATLHAIGAAKYFLDGTRRSKPKPTVDDILVLRFCVPAFFAALTASLDCIALEIHLLVCPGDPSLKSVRKVAFGRLKDRLDCAAQSGHRSEADFIKQLRDCVLCSDDAKKLKSEAFEWRHAYAHRSVVFSGYFDGCAYLFNPNMEPCDIEKWVPPISPADLALLVKTGRQMLPLLEGYWQSARRIIDNSWSVMAGIVDVRRENITAQG